MLLVCLAFAAQGERTVSIAAFGAVANRPDKPATDAIAKAIASLGESGGTVVIPDSIYYTGPITLQNHIHLHLNDGAVLRFLTDINLYYPPVLTRWEGIDCYNTHPLIYAYDCEDIALTGRGTLDAQADEEHWWPIQKSIERRVHDGRPASRLELLRMGEEQVPVEERRFAIEDALRPQFVNFYLCRNVLIEDVHLVSSPFWVIHPLMCEDVIVRGVTIDNHGPNGDGCDPESCRNVLIENCTFNTGDDCIAIKSGRNADGRRWNIPCENVIVRGCHMADGHGGVVVGSEISGGFRNLLVENCTMSSPHLDRVIRIKTSSARGGVIENIVVRNVEVGECKLAVLAINLDYEPEEPAERGFLPMVRNVLLENVTCSKSQYGWWLNGLKDTCRMENIRLKDCRFSGVTSGTNYEAGKVATIEQADEITPSHAPAQSQRIYQGFSGGMMLHTGYLFGQNPSAPKNEEGVLCSPEGATFGIGGAIRVNLWRLLRVGGEGFVSTMSSPLTNCRQLLQPGSFVRSGWGGVNADMCWREKSVWPYVGASVGGGSMRSFYLLQGNQCDWQEEEKTLFHKQPFVYVDPYLGIDWCMTQKVHLTFRLDWLLAFHQQTFVLPTGPRLYVGFMFCH